MAVNAATSKTEINYVSPVLFLLKSMPSCIVLQLSQGRGWKQSWW